MAAFVRFLCVGLINTAIGYAVILLGLWLGWGDYTANAAGYAVGLSVSYGLQRYWAFAVRTPPTLAEMLRFGGAGLTAYAVNLAVITLARHLGYIGNPVAQIVAMAGYSITFFLISRFVVFPQRARHPQVQ